MRRSTRSRSSRDSRALSGVTRCRSCLKSFQEGSDLDRHATAMSCLARARPAGRWGNASQVARARPRTTPQLAISSTSMPCSETTCAVISVRRYQTVASSAPQSSARRVPALFSTHMRPCEERNLEHVHGDLDHRSDEHEHTHIGIPGDSQSEREH